MGENRVWPRKKDSAKIKPKFSALTQNKKAFKFNTKTTGEGAVGEERTGASSKKPEGEGEKIALSKENGGRIVRVPVHEKQQYRTKNRWKSGRKYHNQRKALPGQIGIQEKKE